MHQLGTTFNISNELLREGEKVICAIYGHKQQHNVNELRHYLFGSLTTDPSRLPPCQDATYKHIMRRRSLAPTWTWLEGESKQHFERRGPLWVKTRKTKIRGLPLPCEDLKNRRNENFKKSEDR